MRPNGNGTFFFPLYLNPAIHNCIRSLFYFAFSHSIVLLNVLLRIQANRGGLETPLLPKLCVYFPLSMFVALLVFREIFYLAGNSTSLLLSTRKSNLKVLESTDAQALRTCLGLPRCASSRCNTCHH